MTEDSAQADYYSQTASDYESAHVRPGDEHYVALEYITGLCETVRAGSLLDLGAGTGRGVAFLRGRRPAMTTTGIEPVAELRLEAERRGIEGIVEGDGRSLPFADNEIDVVVALGVMHHIAEPAPVVAEMMRVARKAVVISDSNKYGQSRLSMNFAKVGMRATKTWPLYMQLKTRGKGHYYSEGDGVFYSYSVYDSLPQLAAWSPRTFVIPTGHVRPVRRNTGALLTSSHGVLVSVKEPAFPGWAGTPK